MLGYSWSSGKVSRNLDNVAYNMIVGMEVQMTDRIREARSLKFLPLAEGIHAYRRGTH